MAYVCKCCGGRENYFAQSESEWNEEIESVYIMFRYEVMNLRIRLFRQMREYREYGVNDKDHVDHGHYLKALELMKAVNTRIRDLDDMIAAELPF